MATGTVMDAASREALERAMREQGIEKDSAGEEEEVCEPPAPGPATIPEDWPGYLWHYTKQSGGAVLYVLDSAGEWLAAALGITTPRYQYIIDDLIREQREADAEEKELQEQIKQVEEAESARAKEMEAAAAAASPDSIPTDA